MTPGASVSVPMGLGAILRRTFGLYTRHLPLFLGIAALLPLWLAAISPVMILITSQPSPITPVEEWRRTGWLLRLLVISMFFITCAVVIRIHAATILAASDLHHGHQTGIWHSFARIQRKSLGILWLLTLLNSVAGSFPLLGIPLALFAVYCSPAIPAAILENLKTSEAMRRGEALARGGYGRIILIFLLYAVLLVTWLALFLLFSPVFWNLWVRMPLVALFIYVLMLLIQLWMVMLTLNYYDERVRKGELGPQAGSTF